MDEMIEDPSQPGSGIKIRNPALDDPGIQAIRLLVRWAKRYRHYRNRSGHCHQLEVFDKIYEETMEYFEAD